MISICLHDKLMNNLYMCINIPLKEIYKNHIDFVIILRYLLLQYIKV